MLDKRKISLMLIGIFLFANVFISNSCWWDKPSKPPKAPDGTSSGGPKDVPKDSMATPTPTPVPDEDKTNGELVDCLIMVENDVVMGLFRANEFVMPDYSMLDDELDRARHKVSILRDRFMDSMLTLMTSMTMTHSADEFLDVAIDSYDQLAIAGVSTASMAMTLEDENMAIDGAKNSLREALRFKVRFQMLLERNMLEDVMDNGGL